MSAQGIKTYQKNVFKTNADNRKVVALLYEGVIQSLYIAINAIEAGDSRARTEKIDKALQIIHFMSVALDHEKGGEIAKNLGKLYDYCRDAITQGNIKGDIAKLREVINLFNVVLDGWKQISENSVELDSEGNRTPIPTDEQVEVRAHRPPQPDSSEPTSHAPAAAPPAPATPQTAYGKPNGYARPNGGIAPRPFKTPGPQISRGDSFVG